MKDQKDEVREINFVDLGHGNGKAILTACLILPCLFPNIKIRCMGYELLESLHTQSTHMRKTYLEHYKNEDKEKLPSFDVFLGDFTLTKNGQKSTSISDENDNENNSDDFQDITDKRSFDFKKGLISKNNKVPYASDILNETQIVLCNSTAFDEELFSKVEEICIKYLPIGSFVVTTTKQFKAPNWKIISE